jgi:hypothetical protein
MKMGSFSSIFNRIGLCVGLKIFFFFRPMGLLDLVVLIFFFLGIERFHLIYIYSLLHNLLYSKNKPNMQ